MILTRAERFIQLSRLHPPYVNFIAHYAASITSYTVHITAFVFKEPEYLKWTE